MKSNRIKWGLLALLLLLGALAVGGAPAAAVSETRFIVKYRTGEDWRRKDRSLPYDLVTGAELEGLRAADALEWYEPDGLMELLEGPEAGWYNSEKWDLAMIHAEAAFELGCMGQGVRIGIVDSGVNPHPALAACLEAGRSYLEEGDPADTADRYGHGTLVAGLIAGADEVGYYGAAPGAALVPLKVTDGKTVLTSTVCQAIYNGIDAYHCDILNLSLGIRTESQALREAVEYAEEQGVLVVSAVGNNGNGVLYYPAAYDTVIGVGAVDMDGDVAYHSNRNASVYLTAPGVTVLTLSQYGGVTTASGTSFAVPHVTAAAAVLRGAAGRLSPQALRELLGQTAEDRGPEGWDQSYGYGILNLEAGLLALLGQPDPCSFLPETGPATQLRNNTDEPLEVTYLLAEYDETGVCLGVTVLPMTLPARATAELPPPAAEGCFGQFVYETGTGSPLTRERKTP